MDFINNRDNYLTKLEFQSETFIRKTKLYLPHLARLCICATFIEDGLRMWFQWSIQQTYFDETWGIGIILSSLFVLYNLLIQLSASVLILARFKVTIGIGLLLSVVFLQTLAYPVLWESTFFLRNLALVGGLVLLLAELYVDGGRQRFAGVPMINENKQKEYLQLSGRVLIVFMFMTLIRFSFTFGNILLILLGSVFIVFVSIGYKAKLSALILVVLLSILNIFLHPWWNYEANTPNRDIFRYDFFQFVSVIGGLLFIVILGPGVVSVDEHKKNW